MKGCILIVDDDENIRNLLSIYLENEGFKTIKVDNAKNAIEIIEEKNIELVLLDIMMPQIDGIEACIKIRQNKKMPIIMISAKSEDMDKIHGLTAGADDYITKPFNPLELIARVKAQLRRYTAYNVESNNSKVIIEIGDLTINTDTRQVWVGEKDVRLTPKEF
ncbi:MAG: response regulator transcription factor, partial [Clostridium sp.]|nr:response regulator transcription factor [Clostridium sp.]